MENDEATTLCVENDRKLTEIMGKNPPKGVARTMRIDAKNRGTELIISNMRQFLARLPCMANIDAHKMNPGLEDSSFLEWWSFA